MKTITCDRCGYNEELKDLNSVERILVTKDIKERTVKDNNGGLYQDYIHMYDLELCPDCQEKLQDIISVFLGDIK